MPRALERPQVLNGGWQRSGRSEAIALSTTNFCIVVHTFSVYYRRAEKTLPNFRGTLVLEGGRGIDLDLERGNSKCHTTEFRCNVLKSNWFTDKTSRGYFGG